MSARRNPSSTDTGGTQPNSLRAFEISTCRLPHKRCIASHRIAIPFKNNSYSRSVYGGYSHKNYKLIGI
jgi:hypothetical protein